MDWTNSELVKECVKCGYCCTKGPCAFGLWDFQNNRCKYLTKDNLCSRYEEIIINPMQKYNPAFGYGCCMSLFNDVREKKIKESGFNDMSYKMVEIYTTARQREELDKIIIKKGLPLSKIIGKAIEEAYKKIDEEQRSEGLEDIQLLKMCVKITEEQEKMLYFIMKSTFLDIIQDLADKI